MHLALISKAARLLLVVTVSVWMAGGCLFGCSNGEVNAAEVSSEESDLSAAVSSESCNKARQHDCCTRPTVQKLQKPKAKKQRAATRTASEPAIATSRTVLTSVPHSMKDCPLLTNATAVTAKSNGNLPSPSHSSVAVLPAIKNTSEQTKFTPARSYLPNRGPTYLRCCVFLI